MKPSFHSCLRILLLLLQILSCCRCSNIDPVKITEEFERESKTLQHEYILVRQDIYTLSGQMLQVGNKSLIEKVKSAMEDAVLPPADVLDDPVPPPPGHKRTKRKVRLDVVSGINLWPRNTIPYYIDLGTYSEHGAVRVRKALEEGLKYLETVSCVRFIERSLNTNTRELLGHNHYVRVFNGEACWSYSGCTKCEVMSGATSRGDNSSTFQDMSLSEISCLQSEIVQHEFGHVLGLTHEHTRTDRNNFIAINYGSVPSSSLETYYKKVHPQFVNIAPYDLTSIQHYENHAITTKPEHTWLKQGIGKFTHYDEWSINQAYCSAECSSHRCENDGYPISNSDGTCRCICPEGLSGSACSLPINRRRWRSGCGGIINLRWSRTRYVRTSGYPRKHPTGMVCYWLIMSKPGTVIKTELVGMNLTVTDGQCRHYIEVRDNLIAQVSRMKCGVCTPPNICYESTSSTNVALVKFNASSASYPAGTGAKLRVSAVYDCNKNCRGASCNAAGTCQASKITLVCGFETGLVSGCSNVKLHDAYQKPYTDYTWTEAPWEVTNIINIPGLAPIRPFGGRYHLHSIQPYPFTEGPYEGVFRITPHYISPGSRRCLSFHLFLCCDGSSTLTVSQAIDGELQLPPLFKIDTPTSSWRWFRVAVPAASSSSSLVEVVFKASHNTSNPEANHLGIDSIYFPTYSC